MQISGSNTDTDPDQYFSYAAADSARHHQLDVADVRAGQVLRRGSGDASAQLNDIKVPQSQHAAASR
jgi:hypothetical protein